MERHNPEVSVQSYRRYDEIRVVYSSCSGSPRQAIIVHDRPNVTRTQEEMRRFFYCNNGLERLYLRENSYDHVGSNDLFNRQSFQTHLSNRDPCLLATHFSTSLPSTAVPTPQLQYVDTSDARLPMPTTVPVAGSNITIIIDDLQM